jgi:hypothetical protein
MMYRFRSALPRTNFAVRPDAAATSMNDALNGCPEDFARGIVRTLPLAIPCDCAGTPAAMHAKKTPADRENALI